MFKIEKKRALLSWGTALCSMFSRPY